jgi:L-lactate utilization protein LutB
MYVTALLCKHVAVVHCRNACSIHTAAAAAADGHSCAGSIAAVSGSLTSLLLASAEHNNMSCTACAATSPPMPCLLYQQTCTHLRRLATHLSSSKHSMHELRSLQPPKAITAAAYQRLRAVY